MSELPVDCSDIKSFPIKASVFPRKRFRLTPPSTTPAPSGGSCEACGKLRSDAFENRWYRFRDKCVSKIRIRKLMAECLELCF
ncbi:hypothetical protein EVAR_27201_1 [Eumeta japonica]|uniref:Uncharacterized protein n=1 Tax=Eumeta variegata TaxID=151549 RepID=A0A4C1VUN0_EUMVA|nr:hypothetical protein EVAR_27201_1 [Eumeta japonica]